MIDSLAEEGEGGTAGEVVEEGVEGSRNASTGFRLGSGWSVCGVVTWRGVVEGVPCDGGGCADLRGEGGGGRLERVGESRGKGGDGPAREARRFDGFWGVASPPEFMVAQSLLEDGDSSTSGVPRTE